MKNKTIKVFLLTTAIIFPSCKSYYEPNIEKRQIGLWVSKDSHFALVIAEKSAEVILSCGVLVLDYTIDHNKKSILVKANVTSEKDINGKLTKLDKPLILEAYMDFSKEGMMVLTPEDPESGKVSKTNLILLRSQEEN